MLLEFKNINKHFGKHHVLKDLNFKVKSGQIFGFLGRNGAGKTTAIRILMDVFKAETGSILMDAKPFSPKDYSIGYLPEERGMYSKSLVKDQLVYFAMLRGASRKEAHKSVQFWCEKFEIEEYLNKKLETLSKGNQQKVQITQAFLNEPDILILDEPFSGLDPVNSKLFQDALSEYISKDKIIIFSSHQMSYVETFCDDIAIIDDGEIILEGNLSKIKRDWGGSKKRLVSKDKNLIKTLKDLSYDFFEDKSSLVVELKEKEKLNDFISKLIKNNIELDSFSAYEPSLQEIFISKVGERE